MKVEIDLSEAQVGVLERMGDIYGATVQERLRHVLTDILVAKKREQDMAPTQTIPFTTVTPWGSGTGPDIIC
jgi:hypothetical protein